MTPIGAVLRRRREASVYIDAFRIVLILTAVGATAFIAAVSDSAETTAFYGSLVMSAALLLPVLIEVFTDEIRQAISPINVLSFAVIYWLFLDPIQGLYALPVESFTPVTLFAMTAAFLIGSTLGMHSRISLPKRTLHWLTVLSWTRTSLFWTMCSCWALQMSFYLWKSNWDPGLFVSSLFLGRGMQPWSRGALGDESAFVEALTYFGYIMPSLLVMLGRKSRRLIDPLFLIGTVLTGFSLFCIGSDGSRRLAGFAVVAALFLYFMSDRITRGTLSITNVKLWIKYGLTTVAVGVLLNLMLETRGSWSNSEFTGERLYSGIYVDDNFLRMCQVIEAVPRYADFVGLQPIFFALARPIPRALWPGKPVSPGFTIHEYLGITEASLSTGLIAELFTCFGWYTVALGGFVFGLFGCAVRSMQQAANAGGGLLLYCTSLGWLFVSLRSMTDMAVFTYPVIAVAAVITARSMAIGSGSAKGLPFGSRSAAR